MLARKKRLPVSRASEKPQKVLRTPFFSLKIFANDLEYNRFRVIVGSKVEKSAVDRNYWKRRLMAFFAAKPNLGKDFLIILSSGAKVAAPRGVIAELEKIFHALNSAGGRC